MVFIYKIACLYFGSSDASTAIDYLNRIINGKSDLRSDLQCYARLLSLIAHYELSSRDPGVRMEFLESRIKSVWRFMGSMKNLSTVEMEIFAFLRRSFELTSQTRVRTAFKELRERLLVCQKDLYESRSFMYLDIIAWLESKIEGISVQEVIRRKVRV